MHYVSLVFAVITGFNIFLSWFFFPWKTKWWKRMFLCFSSSWRACSRLQTLCALWSSGGELMLSMAVNECRAFMFVPNSVVTQFLWRFPERHWCASLCWMVYLLLLSKFLWYCQCLVTVTVKNEPIIRHGFKMIVLNSHALRLPRGLSWAALAARLFPWSQGWCPAPLGEN